MSKVLTAAEEVQLIRKKLKHFSLVKECEYWLDTGSSYLNAALGSEEFGIPYGKMIELFGPESHGKTVLMTLLLALAQNDGAYIALLDLECSFDPVFVRLFGLEPERVAIFRPDVVSREEKDGSTRLDFATGEDLFEEAEEWIKYIHQKDEKAKIAIGVDSIANLLVNEEYETGLAEFNMSTNFAQSKFLSRALRRWSGLAYAMNAMVIFVNQLRSKPDLYHPEYTPGGRAAKHACSVRASVRRISGGRMVQAGETVGIIGKIRNEKNKSGRGSREGRVAGFQCRFDKGSWAFMSEAEVDSEAGKIFRAKKKEKKR